MADEPLATIVDAVLGYAFSKLSKTLQKIAKSKIAKIVHEYFSLRALAPLFIMAVLVLSYFLVNRWLSVALLVLNLACFTLLESYLDQDSLSYLGVLLVVMLLVFFFAYIMFVMVPNGRKNITLCRHKMRGSCSKAKCSLQSIADHYRSCHELDKDGYARVRSGSFLHQIP